MLIDFFAISLIKLRPNKMAEEVNATKAALSSLRPPPPRDHDPLIDDIRGLRAVAIAAVLVYHARPDWLPIGYLGVDM